MMNTFSVRNAHRENEQTDKQNVYLWKLSSLDNDEDDDEDEVEKSFRINFYYILVSHTEILSEQKEEWKKKERSKL